MNDDIDLSEERLLAYVDGELPPAEAARIEAALAAHAGARAFVERERGMRQRLQAAFAPVMDEPVPERLMAAARGAAPAAAPATTPAPAAASAAAPVIDLAAQRERRQPASTPAPAFAARAQAAWPAWIGMAASLLLGLLIGQRWLAPGAGEVLVAQADGAWVAQAGLAQALSNRTAAQSPADDAVRLGPSFVARSGRYCRSFSLVREAMAGYACREGEAWQVQMLAKADAAGGGYRQAGTGLPAPVLQAIEAQIAGAPLDAAAEAAAVQRGWRR
jgi:anti-sigma factor RsiW